MRIYSFNCWICGRTRKRLEVSVSSLQEWWRLILDSICHNVVFCRTSPVLYGVSFRTVLQTRPNKGIWEDGPDFQGLRISNDGSNLFCRDLLQYDHRMDPILYV